MAKSEWQKLKLPLLERLLLQETDEEHPMSLQTIIETLAQNGVTAERKSIYRDMSVLRELGLDIQSKKGKSPGWFVGERPFPIAELKLLVDAVESCKFISEHKSNQLVTKLKTLASCYQAQQLQRQVYITARVKTMNESIHRSIDKLQTAITWNHAVTFRYFEYSIDKKKVFLNGGKRYQVSPCQLVWDSDNYYLVGYAHTYQELRHYRVDKMAELAVTCLDLQGRETMKNIDMPSYVRKHFGMSSGQEGMITLRCDRTLVGVVLDRFGQEVTLEPDGEDAFTVTVQAVVNPQFLSWVFGLGTAIKIISPNWAVEAFYKQVKAVLQHCEQKPTPAGVCTGEG